MKRRLWAFGARLTLLPFLVFGVVIGVGWTAAFIINAAAPARSQ